MEPEFLNLNSMTALEIVILITVIGLLAFSRTLGTRIAETIQLKWGNNARKLRDLKSHPLFNQINTWREITIKNINYECPLREKLFTDMLDIKLKCLYGEIEETISKSDYFDSDIDTFRTIWTNFQPRVRLNWKQSCEEEGVFGDMIRRMDEIYEEKADVIQRLIISVCRDDSKKTIFEKTKTILDIHRAVYYSLLSHTLEDILKSINGELNKREYKGFGC
jgi:hypothetical protein